MPRWQTIVAILALLGLVETSRGGENWPQSPGPTGDGRRDSKNLPTEWSLETDKNVAWKTELPSWSGGTPVIWGERIFITSPNKAAQDPAAGGQEPAAKGPGGKGGFGGGGKGGFGGKGGG